ncbi:prokaryotic phospholipase A2-domain-containing protein [Kalaharituber pfeilii]|nr:prokaryotic phospholipase A2-domain-containing protein [Kalaharituber pfeilii]
MKISAVLLLSMGVLANAAAIAQRGPPVSSPAPAPLSASVDPAPEEFDVDDSREDDDDVRGNVPDTEALADDEEFDSEEFDEEFNDYNITARGNVPDLLPNDEIPDFLEAHDSLIARGIAYLTKRETKGQATDRLCFTTSLSSFLAAKKKKSPGSLIWTDDGCSNSPDHPAGFNFLHSCQRHDFGYRNFKNQNRFTKANRKRIDDKFQADLYNECAKYGILQRTACRGLADTYYRAVRLAGGL